MPKYAESELIEQYVLATAQIAALRAEAKTLADAGRLRDYFATIPAIVYWTRVRQQIIEHA